MVEEVQGVNDRASTNILLGLLVICGAPLLGGCVVLEEKYNAEKTRSLNFQRLLAQEEKRTAELDSEVKRTKHELAAFETRNRELAVQVQSVRDQMTRLQEEAEAIKEAAVLERKAMEDMRRAGAPSARPKKSGTAPDAFGDLGVTEPDLHKDAGRRDVTAIAEPGLVARPGTAIHVVRPGETLFRISRRYGIEVEKLKKMNKLQDDIIEVGQKLIVGAE
ncbi:MAG: LysM peptidoglycan-binding domain-containing protein [Nitrospiraceae bacterium]